METEYEEIFEIIKRVKNGEKAEELIDFDRENICGLTPQQALEFVNEALYCCSCKRQLKEDELFTCKECLEKSKEHFYNTEIGKSLKDSGDNGWGWLFGLMIFSSLGNNNDKDNGNDND